MDQEYWPRLYPLESSRWIWTRSIGRVLPPSSAASRKKKSPHFAMPKIRSTIFEKLRIFILNNSDIVCFDEWNMFGGFHIKNKDRLQFLLINIFYSKQTQIRNAGDNPTSILTKFYNNCLGRKIQFSVLEIIIRHFKFINH